MFKNISIRKRLLIIFLLVSVLPLIIFGYFFISKFRHHHVESVRDIGDFLKKEAEINLSMLLESKSEKISNFLEGAARDLEAFSSTINAKHTNKFLQLEYRLGNFAFWAYSDWENHADKQKIEDILNEDEKSENFEKLKQVLDAQEMQVIEDFLSIVINDKFPDYENLENLENYYPRFVVEKNLFALLQKKIGDKISLTENKFLLLDFLFELLEDEAQSIVLKGLQMIRPGKALVDLSDNYVNLRIAYWGDGMDGVELIYSGKNAPIHPAFNGVGNSYYCKSVFLLKESKKVEPVWVLGDILDEKKKIASVVFPVYEEFYNPESSLVGFAEYWIDWTTLTDQIKSVSFFDNSFSLILDNTGRIISDKHKEHLGMYVFNIHSELSDYKNFFNNGEKFITRKINGEDYYIFYSLIKETGWYIVYATPLREVMAVAREQEEHAHHHLKELLIALYLYSLVIVFVVIIVTFFATKPILRPINTLIQATKELARGKKNTKINIDGDDEIGELAKNFNLMSLELSNRKGEIEKTNKDLEKEVKRRTKELEKSKEDIENKLYELEIYSKTSIDRELRMIELKEQIKDLKKKLKSNQVKKNE